MKKSKRSAYFPRIDLLGIIKKLRNIKLKEFEGKVNEEALAQAMGYVGISGASMVYLSSTKRFGLLEKTGFGYKFSDDINVLLNSSFDSEKDQKILEEAAFAPEIFREIREHFGKNFPPRNLLGQFLVDKKFELKTIPHVIESYKETFNFVAAHLKDYSVSALTNENQFDYLARAGEVYEDLPATGFVDNTRRIDVNLGGVLRATVTFHDPITQKSIEQLIKFLQRNKDSFPED